MYKSTFDPALLFAFVFFGLASPLAMGCSSANFDVAGEGPSDTLFQLQSDAGSEALEASVEAGAGDASEVGVDASAPDGASDGGVADSVSVEVSTGPLTVYFPVSGDEMVPATGLGYDGDRVSGQRALPDAWSRTTVTAKLSFENKICDGSDTVIALMVGDGTKWLGPVATVSFSKYSVSGVTFTGPMPAHTGTPSALYLSYVVTRHGLCGNIVPIMGTANVVTFK